MKTNTIALLSDFGTTDPFVSAIKGVLYTKIPRLTIIDITHQVPPQDIARLRVKESYTTQTGTRSTTIYRVQVELRNGKAITVADSLHGRETAEHLLRTLARSTGFAGG